jgi:hypothetical protein
MPLRLTNEPSTPQGPNRQDNGSSGLVYLHRCQVVLLRFAYFGEGGTSRPFCLDVLGPVHRVQRADERTRTADLISLRVSCYGGVLWKTRPSPFKGVGGGPRGRRGPGYRELTEARKQPSSAFRVLPVLVAEAFDQLFLLFRQAHQQ